MRKWLFIGLALLPIFLHVFLLYAYTLDFPFEDDFRVVAKYLYLFLSQESSAGKSHIFFLGENESFPLVQRMLVYGQYFLSGEQHVRGLLIFCNFLLVFLVHIFYKNAKETPTYIYLFIALLLFNPVHHEMYFRLDVASYQFMSTFLAICTIYIACNWDKQTVLIKYLFLLCYILSPLGSINGIFAHFFILMVFILRKQYREFVILSILSFSLILFLKYLSAASDSPTSVIDNIVKYNFQLIYAYCISVGSMFGVFQGPKGYLISFAFGCIIILSNLFLVFKYRKKGQWFEICLFLFSALTLAVIVTLRYNYWFVGYESVLVSRYKLYGALMSISALMLYFKNYPKPSKYLVGLLFLVLLGSFSIGTVRGIGMMNRQNLTQLTEAFNLNQNILIKENYNVRYINFEEQSFLESKNAYNGKLISKKLDSILTKSHILTYENYTLKPFEDDPTLKGDWKRLSIPLHQLRVYGKVQSYKYYFAKITDSKNKKIVTYLYPQKNSFLSPIFINKNKVNSILSQDFYFGFFELQAPYTLTLYGTDTL